MQNSCSRLKPTRPPPGKAARAPLSQSTLDSFHGALSDAVSSTLEKFGIHPSDVKISITRASAESTAALDKFERRQRRTRSTYSWHIRHPEALQLERSLADSALDPFLEAAINNPYPVDRPDGLYRFPNGIDFCATGCAASFRQLHIGPPSRPLFKRSGPCKIRNSARRWQPQLASEGYSIDVPIMVWGWDPSITTAMRQADGYTWVPSALQNPVEDAPGLPGMGTPRPTTRTTLRPVPSRSDHER